MVTICTYFNRPVLLLQTMSYCPFDDLQYIKMYYFEHKSSQNLLLANQITTNECAVLLLIYTGVLNKTHWKNHIRNCTISLYKLL